MLSPQQQALAEAIKKYLFGSVLEIEITLIEEQHVLGDFILFGPENALRPGIKPGHFVFHSNHYRGPKNKDLPPDEKKRNLADPKNWINREFEAVPDLGRDWIIQKVKDVWGVDVAKVIDGKIFDLVNYIATHATKDQR